MDEGQQNEIRQIVREEIEQWWRDQWASVKDQIPAGTLERLERYRGDMTGEK